MARYSIISITFFLVIFVVSNVSCQDVECTDSVQCSTKYCRLGKCIEFGDSSNDVDGNPCDRVRCAGICVLQQVQCIRAPCPPVAKCVPCTETLCS